LSQTPLDRLLHRLDLEPAGQDVFRGEPGGGEGRVFGGMLAAQALVAAGRTIERGMPHSVHAYFLRSGRHGVPITWRVTRVRDGVSFAARRVSGEQSGEELFALTASFTRQQAGLAHQDPMPAAPPPDGLPDWEDLRVQVLGPDVRRRPDGPLEVRECDPATATPQPGRAARRAIWMRPRGVLPDDPLVHAAVLAFATDRSLLSTAGRPHGLMWGAGLGASLDHAIWLHQPPRFDGWVLYASESPVAAAGRGFVHGAMYRADGVRIASVAQEGLIRVLPRRARVSASRR
jgi:acyl-CoA thioesterase II